MGLRETVLILGIAAGLSGCADFERGEYKPPAAEPVDAIAPEVVQLDTGLTQAPVRVGDVFVYDNPPTRWEVVSVRHGFIGWRNESGEERQTSYSTIFPPVAWLGSARSGRRSIDVVSGGLHPLEKGKSVRFTTDTLHVRPPGTDRAMWDCVVQDQKEIVVKAGKAEVFDVLCYRNGKQYVLLSYAPSLGSYVRAVLANGAQPVVRELTGYARGADMQTSAAGAADTGGSNSDAGSTKPAGG